LPLPHPLEFEWRFTPETSRLLLDWADDLAPPGSAILLFGTPGAALEALSLPGERKLIFYGEDNVVTSRLRALNEATGFPLNIYGCGSGLPTTNAGAVILDPPWYLDFMRPMIAVGARALRPLGYLFISLPPDGAGRSAAEDRERVIRFARRLGLELVDRLPLSLGYDTPFFERNALAAAGMRVTETWRHGDLVVFRKPHDISQLASIAHVRKERWSEVEIGRMRLFVRRNYPTSAALRGLISIVKGDILPTVKRRDPRRRRAAIWTSGNRLFASDHTELVIEAALSISAEPEGSGVQPSLWRTIPERAAIEQIAETLRAIALQEAAEERTKQASAFGNGDNGCISRLRKFGGGSVARAFG
jgi:hypothetical protein